MSYIEDLQDEPSIRERLPSDPPPQTLEAAFNTDAVQGEASRLMFEALRAVKAPEGMEYAPPALEELQDAAAEELCVRAQEVSERYPDEFDGHWLFNRQCNDMCRPLITSDQIAEDLQTLLQYAGMVTQINEGLVARVEELEAELSQISRSRNP